MPDGTPVISFTLNFSSEAGSRPPEGKRAQWIDIVAIGSHVLQCRPVLARGGWVQVEGSLRHRRFETKEGITREKIEVVARKLSSRESLSGEGAGEV